jgi:hypothetical protein
MPPASVLTRWVDCRNGSLRSKGRDLSDAAAEERIRENQKCASLLKSDGPERGIDFVRGVGFKHTDLAPGGLSCRLDFLLDRFKSWIGWVQEQRNHASVGRQYVQQTQTLCSERSRQEAYTRYVASRSGEAADKARGHRVDPREKHDWDGRRRHLRDRGGCNPTACDDHRDFAADQI